MDRFNLRRVQDAFAGPLEKFVQESGVRLAVLINRSGQVLAQHGFDTVMDLVGVASLAAGINASSRALANQIGEHEFEHLHHAGRVRQLFLGHFDTQFGQVMLVAVFDEGSSIGLVRVFFRELTKRLGRLRAGDVVPSSMSRLDFEMELEASLDRFFQDLLGG